MCMDWMRRAIRAPRDSCGPSARSSPARTGRGSMHGLVQQGLLRFCLTHPRRPVRHREQRPARAARQRERPAARYGQESSLVPTVPKRPVRGHMHPHSVRPALPPSAAASSRWWLTGQPAPLVLAPGRIPARGPSCSRGTGPRRSPVPGRPARRGRHGLADGSSARSPASAAIASPALPGHDLISTITRIMNALAAAFPVAPSRTGRAAAPAGAIPLAPPGLALLLQRPQRRVMDRAALGPDLPQSRLTCAPATATTLQNTTRRPIRDLSLSVAPNDPSADRSALPEIPAALQRRGQPAPAGTATIIPAETGAAHDGTG